MSTGRSTSGPLMLLAASVLWGTVGTAQALADLGADGPVVGASRLAGGAVALWVVGLALCGRRRMAGAWARGPSGAPPPPLRSRPFTSRREPGPRRWTLAAGFAVAVYQAAFFAAVARTGVAVGTLVALAAAPVGCGVLARALIGERLPRGWAAATVCALAGCGLLLAPGAEGTADPLGVALALVAGCCYAVYTVSGKQALSAGVEPLAFLAGSVAVGALVLAPVLILGAGQLASARGIALVAWLGLAATAVGYVLFVRGLALVPAAAAGTLSLAEPLTAALLGVLVLGERPSATAAVGAALLAGGLALAALGAYWSGRPAAAAMSGRSLST